MDQSKEMGKQTGFMLRELAHVARGSQGALSRNIGPTFWTNPDIECRPNSDLTQPIAIMDIHGKMDTFVNYYEEWDWKEGEFVDVGTMKDVPSNVAFWAEKENCMEGEATQTPQYEHIIHRDEFGLVLVPFHWNA